MDTLPFKSQQTVDDFFGFCGRKHFHAPLPMPSGRREVSVGNVQSELTDRGLQGSRDEEQSSQRGGGEDGLGPAPWTKALQKHGGE